MTLLAAISQPCLCVDWTLTAGQSLFCTTAVGASMKVPAGEYSMRTSDGVRNSKRAFPARMVGWLCVLAPHATSAGDRKSTRLNSSHSQISYAVFCLKKKNQIHRP